MQQRKQSIKGLLRFFFFFLGGVVLSFPISLTHAAYSFFFFSFLPKRVQSHPLCLKQQPKLHNPLAYVLLNLHLFKYTTRKKENSRNIDSTIQNNNRDNKNDINANDNSVAYATERPDIITTCKKNSSSVSHQG